MSQPTNQTDQEGRQLALGLRPSALFIARDDGKTRMERGIKRVLRHADAEWKERAIALIKQLAARKSEFTSDDVRAFAKEAGLPAPRHRNAWGAIMLTAAKLGVIAPTGRFTKSQRAEAHARMVGVWRSLAHGNK